MPSVRIWNRQGWETRIIRRPPEIICPPGGAPMELLRNGLLVKIVNDLDICSKVALSSCSAALHRKHIFDLVPLSAMTAPRSRARYPTGKSPRELLPQELLDLITSFVLSPLDRACLILCNKTLIAKRGTLPFRHVNVMRGKLRTAWLYRLAEESPGRWSLCERCVCPHHSCKGKPTRTGLSYLRHVETQNKPALGDARTSSFADWKLSAKERLQTSSYALRLATKIWER
ncbi:hypothetical protein BJ170DRAFT_196202 [Xylariales sp. AK1849]|nr:hypothetical protein BJ170DRAFT_196202 [Xylariales sp. AK1849]